MRSIRRFLNNRPLGTFAIIFALRDLILALAFMVKAPEIVRSLMYEGITEIVSPELFGIIFGLVAVSVIVLALLKRYRAIQVALDLEAFVWLFIGFIYAMNGIWFWALVFGFLMSVLLGYLSYRFKLKRLFEEDE